MALIPAGLRGFGWPFLNGVAPAKTILSGSEFHLHTHYRTPAPLDALLLKTQAGLDEFVTEKYAEEVATILGQWSLNLLQAPQDVSGAEKVLLPNFNGSSLRPAESRVVRPGPPIEVRRNTFNRESAIPKDAFLHELRSTLSSFSRILTAEFQVTSIDAGPALASAPANQLHTRIRYELVATGRDFYREQRVGYWQMAWERSASGDLRMRKWETLEETQSRFIGSGGPAYIDITAGTLGGNASYSAQLLHGTDYWRTVLDGACGIDIYGHNGVSVGDIDGDGFDDLYVCQPGGLPNRLYRNRGDGNFEDITESAGVGVIENTACALIVDVDNDGRQDLIVVRATGPMLFINQGNGKFRQKADAFQFVNPPQGTFTGAAVADYDRDGWLDVYFCLYVYYQGSDQYKYPSPYYAAENGPPNFMMRNNRNGTFRDVTAETGLNQNNTRYSFCCGWGDFNGDGWPDLYVVNDFGRKNLYQNNGNGTFTDIAPQARVEDIGAGMSVCWLDYDNDGAEDFYVADMWTAAGERISTQDIFKKDASTEARAFYRKHAMGNSLFRNRSRSGDAAFEDTTRSAGVGIGRWAWSSDAWDFDHDGFPDLYIANGMVSGPSREDLNSFFWRQVVAYSPDQAQPSHNYERGWSAINELIRADGTWSGYERNIFYANNGDGTFSDISGVVGLDFLEDGRAFALADFDLDGRLEVFLKNRNGPQLRVLKNVMENLPPSISFRLRGLKSNHDAIGAVVTVKTDLGRQSRSLQAGSGFLSQHSKDVFFGLGAAKGPVQASIRWPNGLVQELLDLPINHRVWVEEGSEPTRIEAFKTQTGQRGPADANSSKAIPQRNEELPNTAETWLLAPIEAPEFSLSDIAGQSRNLASLRGKPVLLNFWEMGAERSRDDWKSFNQRHAAWAAQGLQLLSVNLDSPPNEQNLQALVREQHLSFPILRGSEDVAAIYNILYRYIFDRHRDLVLPTSFLINPQGEIVKVYQGPVDPRHVEQDFRHIPQTGADRLARALPFPGVTDTIEFGRNYLSFGSVFFQRGYMDQAAASFQIAVRDDPASAEALYGIGSVYLNQQKNAEAREIFEHALKLRANYPDTLANSWNNLGLLAAREGRTGEAVGYFQEALKLRPVYPEALNNLGILYLRTQRRDEAVASFEECISVAPAFDQAYLNLARVYAIEGARDKARAVLLNLLQQHPGHEQAQKMLEQLGR